MGTTINFRKTETVFIKVDLFQIEILANKRISLEEIVQASNFPNASVNHMMTFMKNVPLEDTETMNSFENITSTFGSRRSGRGVGREIYLGFKNQQHDKEYNL